MKKRVFTIFVSLLLCLIFAIPTVGCAKKSFTVTFDADGGERVGGGELVQEVKSASEIVEPELEKEGYAFIGWDTVLMDITEDTTVKALWDKDKFVVTFIVSGYDQKEGGGEDVQAVASGSELDAPRYVKKGYTLAWQDENKNPIKLSDINSACNVIGVWVANEYKLQFRNNDGSTIDGIQDINIVYGQAIPSLRTTKKVLGNGKKISGWVISGTSKRIESSQAWHYDKDLIVNPILVDEDAYLIHYELNGGEESVSNPTWYTRGDNPSSNEEIVINAPQRKGYDFVGWEEVDENGEKLVDAKSIVIIGKETAEDKYYEARWKAQEYTITFEIPSETNAVFASNGTKTFQKKIKYNEEIGELPVLQGENVTQPLFWYTEYEDVTYKYVFSTDKWLTTGSVTLKPKNVMLFVFEFVLDECTVRGKKVEIVYSDANPITSLRYMEGETIDKNALPKVEPKDKIEYSIASWRYKDESNNYVSIDGIGALIANKFGEKDIKNNICTIKLYAWCRSNWTPSY